MDRRLLAVRQRAAAELSQPATGLDLLLASMGSRRAAEAVTASATASAREYTPRTEGVGEAVWDPTVSAESRAPNGRMAPEVELLRAQALRRLQAGLEAELISTVGEKLVSKLEVHSSQTLRNGNGLVDRWLAERRIAAAPTREGGGSSSADGLPPSDPILPLPYTSAHEVPELLAELQGGGVSAECAIEAAVGFGRVATDAADWFRRRSLKAPPSGSVVLREIENEMLEIRSGRIAHKINRTHCHKLLQLYCRAHGREVAQSDQGFMNALYCLLLRYESLGGAGMQAALNGAAFDVLKSRFGVAAECFASPLNCRFEGFCSAFPDIDVHFGGRGDFFRIFGGRWHAPPLFPALPHPPPTALNSSPPNSLFLACPSAPRTPHLREASRPTLRSYQR